MAKHKKGKRVTLTEEIEVFDLLNQGRKVPAIARKTGISESKLYTLIKRGPPIATKHPTNPLQKEVWDMCRDGNHDWMASVKGIQRYKDQAFSQQVVYEATDEEGVVLVREISTDAFRGSRAP